MISTAWIKNSVWACLNGGLSLFHYLWTSLGPFNLPCKQVAVNIRHTTHLCEIRSTTMYWQENKTWLPNLKYLPSIKFISPQWALLQKLIMHWVWHRSYVYLTPSSTYILRTSYFFKNWHEKRTSALHINFPSIKTAFLNLMFQFYFLAYRCHITVPNFVVLFRNLRLASLLYYIKHVRDRGSMCNFDMFINAHSTCMGQNQSNDISKIVYCEKSITHQTTQYIIHEHFQHPILSDRGMETMHIWGGECLW